MWPALYAAGTRGSFNSPQDSTRQLAVHLHRDGSGRDGATRFYQWF